MISVVAIAKTVARKERINPRISGDIADSYEVVAVPPFVVSVKLNVPPPILLKNVTSATRRILF